MTAVLPSSPKSLFKYAMFQLLIRNDNLNLYLYFFLVNLVPFVAIPQSKIGNRKSQIANRKSNLSFNPGAAALGDVFDFFEGNL